MMLVSKQWLNIVPAAISECKVCHTNFPNINAPLTDSITG